ncbi:hypothetical protein B0T16DRAFT_462308 [Cercophora newfieldiana]|uniref:BTB domain-containing protein n=1 Tax=Cercophora newfieldiana TaxID=92897 RepID=A0AA39XQU6_9PEZI|nr:hypothetical protein B0T16DRAFT_462308 [Cercophora newfieldiana]
MATTRIVNEGVIGPDEKRFLVCSHVLALASPAFNEVKLPEDDAGGAEVLLDIVHTRFQRVPLTPEATSLYNLLVFADKYDMRRLLLPWADRWASHLADLDCDAIPTTSPQLTYALVATLELGNRVSIQRLLGCIASHSAIDDQGRLVDSNGELFKREGMPLVSSELFETVARLRMHYLREIFINLRIVVNRLKSSAFDNEPIESSLCPWSHWTVVS